MRTASVIAGCSWLVSAGSIKGLWGWWLGYIVKHEIYVCCLSQPVTDHMGIVRWYYCLPLHFTHSAAPQHFPHRIPYTHLLLILPHFNIPF